MTNSYFIKRNSFFTVLIHFLAISSWPAAIAGMPSHIQYSGCAFFNGIIKILLQWNIDRVEFIRYFLRALLPVFYFCKPCIAVIFYFVHAANINGSHSTMVTEGHCPFVCFNDALSDCCCLLYLLHHLRQ
jgi:hypothetical protein